MSDINNYVSVAEYAALHNMNAESVKKRCQRNSFKSARKLGRDWIIDKNELLSDNRVKSGKYKKD